MDAPESDLFYVELLQINILSKFVKVELIHEVSRLDDDVDL